MNRCHLLLLSVVTATAAVLLFGSCPVSGQSKPQKKKPPTGSTAYVVVSVEGQYWAIPSSLLNDLRNCLAEHKPGFAPPAVRQGGEPTGNPLVDRRGQGRRQSTDDNSDMNSMKIVKNGFKTGKAAWDFIDALAGARNIKTPEQKINAELVRVLKELLDVDTRLHSVQTRLRESELAKQGRSSLNDNSDMYDAGGTRAQPNSRYTARHEEARQLVQEYPKLERQSQTLGQARKKLDARLFALLSQEPAATSKPKAEPSAETKQATPQHDDK